MATVPDSTKTSLQQRLSQRAQERWPALDHVSVRHRAGFAYLTGHLPDGENLPLCRLRYGGYANSWGFAIYRARHDDYADSILPSGAFAGTAEKPSTAPAGSTSTTLAPGPDPRRTYGRDH
jgi:hypothetical protein